MVGIFFCLHTLGFFFLWLSNTRLEFVCEINSGDQRWVNISINKSQNRKEPLNVGEAALGVCLSVSSAVVGEWWDRCWWDRCQCVRVFVFVVGFTFFNVPASVHPLTFCGLALWQGCVEGEDLGTLRAAERSGECPGLHSSSLQRVCRMRSQKNDNLSVQKGKSWHGGSYTAHPCPSSHSLSLTLFFFRVTSRVIDLI